MKQNKLNRFLRAVGEMDEAVLARYETIDARITAERRARKRHLWRSLNIAAVLFLVALPVSLLLIFPPGHASHNCPLPHETETAGPEELTTTRLGPVIQYSPDVSGKPIFLVGSSTLPPSYESSDPPAFCFESTGVVVKARVIEALPETFWRLGSSAEYRLVYFEALDVLHGEGVPSVFLYLLPAYLFTDLTAYDYFLLSMTQLGIEDFMLVDADTNQICYPDNLIFGDIQNHPELGNIIAFTDGVFDESLWQNESWLYGYQFARSMLDESSDELVVRRGGTIEETEARIREEIQAEQERQGDLYRAPTVYTYRDLSDEAKEALGDFGRSVFAQTRIGNSLQFRRYINGCEADEIIQIDLVTGEVTTSGVTYTKSDRVVFLPFYLNELSRAYENDLPAPPHVDPTGKELYSLWLEAWYVKRDTGIYGIIKTGWIYTAESDEGYPVSYQDESFLLFDADTPEGRPITREELVKLIGEDRHLYWGEYGTPDPIPY